MSCALLLWAENVNASNSCPPYNMTTTGYILASQLFLKWQLMNVSEYWQKWTKLILIVLKNPIEVIVQCRVHCQCWPGCWKKWAGWWAGWSAGPWSFSLFIMNWYHYPIIYHKVRKMSFVWFFINWNINMIFIICNIYNIWYS